MPHFLIPNQFFFGKIGFRDRHDWFPREIYYSATPQQVRDYNKVSESLDEQNSIVAVKETSPSSQAILGVGAGDDSMHVHSHVHSHSHSHSHSSGLGENKKEEVAQEHQHHQHLSGASAGTTPSSVSQPTASVGGAGGVSEVAQLKNQLQESQGQMLLLLQQLTKQQEQNVEQQTQLREQQKLFASQLGELQGHILTLLKASP